MSGAGTTEDEQDATRPGVRSGPAGGRLPAPSALFAASCAVIVACLVALVVLLVAGDDGGDDGDGDGGGGGAAVGSEADQLQRDAVMSATQQFVVRINTYGPDLLADDGTMPEYADGVSALMTEEFAAGFRESVAIPEQQVAQSGYARTGQVFGLGVADMSDESATVLVGFTRTDSYPRQGGGADRVELAGDPERWQVELVRNGDEWLVDNYLKVPEVMEEEGASPSVPPATTPPADPSSPAGGQG